MIRDEFVNNILQEMIPRAGIIIMPCMPVFSALVQTGTVIAYIWNGMFWFASK
jgi:hypothetical protein